jgi:hypothetical protein
VWASTRLGERMRSGVLLPLHASAAREPHSQAPHRQQVHPKIVSEMLGHADISIILRLYAHVTPHMQGQDGKE